MNKHLLLIPFLALLGCSCEGAHITTTPVVKNAPRAVLSAPTKKNLIAPDGEPTSVYFLVRFTDESQATTYKLNGSLWQQSDGDYIPTIRLVQSGTNYYLILSMGNAYFISWSDYVSNIHTQGLVYTSTAFLPFGAYSIEERPCTISGVFHYKPTEHAYQNGYDNGEQAGYQEGRKEGYASGYEDGKEDGYYTDSNKIVANGMYTGLTIFPRRNYLEKYADDVIHGRVTPTSGNLDLIDTNGNYTIHIKWTYLATEQQTRFQDFGNTIVGELNWIEVAELNWSTSWFYLYDKETHMFAQPKTYLGNGPIETSFYPEVYLGSTFQGDPNLYFAGGGNAYQMGFADGQTQTIHASETYQNVFTIFTPAFRAVADFFNLNIGPFKVWYFFAIPLIVTLLILVLRLVKH